MSDTAQTDVFDPMSLAANRAGELTSSQIAWVRRRAVLTAAITSLWVSLLTWALNAGVPISSGGRAPVSIGTWVVVAVVVAAIGLGWYFYATRGIRAGRVASTDGTILKELPIPLRGGALNSMRVGAKRFTMVRKALYDAAPDSGNVRIYFMVGDHKAVNFEVPAAAHRSGFGDVTSPGSPRPL